MRTVTSLLKEACSKFPNSTYVSDKYTGGNWLPRTYIDVDRESDYIASGLLSAGISPMSNVAILSEGRSRWIISEYAIVKIKGAAVPLSVKLLPEEILFRINHSDSKAIVVSKFNIDTLGSIWDKIDCKEFKLICLDADKDVVTAFADTYKVSLGAIITYDELLNIGKEFYSSNKDRIDELVDSIHEDDVVTISYTSGTTGNPKGIMLTHLNYYSNAKDTIEHIQFPLHWKIFIMLPVDHSFAHTVGIFISCFIALGVHFVDSSQGARQTLKNIPLNLKEVRPDVTITVPALSGNFMDKINDGVRLKGGFGLWLFTKGLNAGIKINRDGYKKAGFLTWLWYKPIHALADVLVFSKVRQIFGGNLKMCVGGGALLDIRQQYFFYAIGVPIFQGYGLTEASPIISANCIHAHKMGSSGLIIKNMECKILQEGKEMPVGVKGEIVIKGNNVMKGYYKNPEASAEVLKDGWLHTGDMGFFDSDGFLHVVGREKALLISEDGEKYSPEEIEETIMACSDLIQQVMVYNDHKQFTTAIVAVDVKRLQDYCKEKKLTDPESVIKHLRDSFYSFKHLPEFKDLFFPKWIPTVFRIADEPFSEENKMINSTLKMVRYKITETYSHLIDDMYLLGSNSFVCEHNVNVVQKILEEKIGA